MSINDTNAWIEYNKYFAKKDLSLSEERTKKALLHDLKARAKLSPTEEIKRNPFYKRYMLGKVYCGFFEPRKLGHAYADLKRLLDENTLKQHAKTNSKIDNL